jgi:hypothetical protein
VYNKYNFHQHTYCVFHQVSGEEIADKKPNYSSKSGSQYFFTEEGVYRKSNHWGRAANCRWKLIPNENYKNQQTIVAFANWESFYPNNQTDALFYMYIKDNQVFYGHKQDNFYSNQFLFNSVQIAKRTKEIQSVLESNIWAKYFHFSEEEFQIKKKELLEKLLQTNESFVILKSKLT